MQRMIKALIISFMLIGLTACASVLNPYHDEFSCPNYEKGKCVPIKEAYKESKKQQETSDRAVKDGEKAGKDNVKMMSEATVKDVYEKMLYERLSKLIKQPKTPLLAPPQVLRILILQYRDGKNLYMPRHVYTYINDPLWVIERRRVRRR